jgi:hypothetical protein
MGSQYMYGCFGSIGLDLHCSNSPSQRSIARRLGLSEPISIAEGFFSALAMAADCCSLAWILTSPSVDGSLVTRHAPPLNKGCLLMGSHRAASC